MFKKKDKLKLRRRIWFLLWIFSLIIISNYGGPVSYGLFYAVTILPLMSFIYVLLVLYFFKVYQKLDNRVVVAGDSTKYLFVLKNEGAFPFSSVSVKLYSYFSYVDNMNEDTEYELLKGDEFTFETNLVCKYRGEYYVGIKEVVVTDFLRLFRIRYKIKSNVRAIVNPAITRLKYIESIENVLGTLEKPNAKVNTNRDVLVRDYVVGDSLRQISWKLSAKENKLKVRKENGEEKQGVILIGDTNRCYKDEKVFLPLENKMLEVMSSIGIYLAENNVTYTAYYIQNAMNSIRVDGLSRYQDYYAALCKIRFNDLYSFEESLNQLMLRGILCDSRIIFAVFHRLDEKILATVTELADMGIIVVLYVVTDEDYEEYMKFANERLKIIILPVDANLKEKL